MLIQLDKHEGSTSGDYSVHNMMNTMSIDRGTMVVNTWYSLQSQGFSFISKRKRQARKSARTV
jgi:hypothetical protein